MRRLLRGRGRWLAALVLLAVGAGVGTAVGLAQTGGGADEARLRVEGPAKAVLCGERFPVTVFLDELAARPSPHGEGVEWGLGAVGLRLGYDPRVLRVEEDADVVRPSPDVEQVDVDGNGNAAPLMPIGPFIDNQKGEVFFSEFWVGVDADTEQLYEGPSPAWAGGPVPLFSVTFLANGAGSSALTLSDVEMVDPLEGWYRPVGLEQGSVTVSGEEGGCLDLPLPAPKPTPRPAPTAPPTWTPVPTSTPAPPPQAMEPVPAVEGGRPDCPDGWYVYNDPDGHFSMCYPAGLDATARAAVPGRHGALLDLVTPSTVEIPSFSLIVSRDGERTMLLGRDSPYTCEDMTLVMGQTVVKPVEFAVVNATAVGCAGIGAQGTVGVQMYVPLPLGADVPAPRGYINVLLNYPGGDFDSLPGQAEEILRTLQVEVP